MVIVGLQVVVFKVRDIKPLSRGKALASCFLVTVGTKLVEGSCAGVTIDFLVEKVQN